MNKRTAFSLVELSIVLVILGLLVGGILAGQSLIRASELRAVTAESQRWAIALHAFRDKYFALPGDFSAATTIWGLQAASNCGTTRSSGAATCNGDGDGKILSSSNSNEPFRAWQHLANAGLIEGAYDGLAGTAALGDNSATNTGQPRSKLGGGYWYIGSFGDQTTGYFAYNYDNILQLGASAGAGASPSGAVFKPEELWNIDTKTDDGKPGTGKLIARPLATACNTAANFSDYNADYTLTETRLRCAAMWRRVF